VQANGVFASGVPEMYKPADTRQLLTAALPVLVALLEPVGHAVHDVAPTAAL
jgi:hypothetical protein